MAPAAHVNHVIITPSPKTNPPAVCTTGKTLGEKEQIHLKGRWRM